MSRAKLAKQAANQLFQFGGKALNPVTSFFRNRVGRVPGLRNMQPVVEMAFPARRVSPPVPSSQIGLDYFGRSVARAPSIPSPLGRVGPKNALEQRILDNAMKPQGTGRFQKLGDPGSIFKAITNPDIRINPFKNPARILNPLGTRGSILYGLGADAALNSLGIDVPKGVDEALVGQFLGSPLGLGGRLVGGLVGYELGNPGAFSDGTRNSAMAKRGDEILRTQEYNKQQGSDLDMNAIKQTARGSEVLPSMGEPSYEAFIAGGGRSAIQRGVPLVDVVRQGQINIMNSQSSPVVTTENAKNQTLNTMPPSAEENKYITNPQLTQVELYQKARINAKTPDQIKAVERLGSAIHRAKNPTLYNSAGIFQNRLNPQNPAMNAAYPDRYTRTREASIVEKGIQKPYSMTNADERAQLAEAYQQGVDDALLNLVDNSTLNANSFLDSELQKRIFR